MDTLLENFQCHIERGFPDLKNGKVLLAISGGLDSVVLSHLMLQSQIDLSFAHCNFQLRDDDSLKDELFVAKKGDEFGIRCHVRAFDTLSYARDNKVSIQMAARELRYAWFDELVADYEYDFLITAHHADDNLETFLINLSRGTGIDGLKGIPERSGKIIRPLLPFYRNELEAYAKHHKLEWREDLSNTENKYLRNRIRNELIPVMKEVLPTVGDGFQKTLSNLKDTGELLEEKINEVFEEIVEIEGSLNKISISKINSFLNSKPYLFYILRRFGFTQWDDIQDMLSAQPGKMIFSSSHRLIKDREFLILQRIDQLPSSDESQMIYESQNSVVWDGMKMQIEGLTQISELNNPMKNLALFDQDRLIFPLCVRKWQKGDYFYPQGMTGRKKLSKYFKDEKLSVPEKENIWLLCSGDDIVWIINHREDDRFKVTESTKKVLQIVITDTK